MRGELIICPLKPGLNETETGNKARSLLYLQKKKFRIPETYIIPSGILARYQNRRELFLSNLKKEIANLPDRQYAVRSSTRSEDSEDFTFAGQFRTITNVYGTESLINAVVDVWNSSACSHENEYRRRIMKAKSGCAVLIQEMIDSKLAGVSFSKNPVTNQEEIIIEAVEGPGEDLVQKGITPLRWRYKKGKFLDGDTGYPMISVIRKVASDTYRIRNLFHNHVDIEWVYNGMNLYYLQFRPVTGVSEMNIYSNRMAKEMLPGQIKPLVWSINIPMVNGTWIKLLSEITGRIDVGPEDLAKQFYFRTYFNIASLGKIFREFGLSTDVLEELMMSREESKPSFRPGIKTLRHSLRIIKFIRHKLTFERHFIREYNRLKTFYEAFNERLNNEFSLENYPVLFNRLSEEGQDLTYLNIVIPLLMQIYNKRFKSKLKKIGLDYDLIDFNHDFPELPELSPVTHFRKIKEMIGALPEEKRSECQSFERIKMSAEAAAIADELTIFMIKFGHLSESGTDFSVPKWNENPDLVLHMILKSEPLNSSHELLSFPELGNAGKKSLKRLNGIYTKAGRFKVYREQISSLFIFGHGLFRTLFLKLAHEFVQSGIIKLPEDIFFLYLDEINQIAEGIHDGNISSYYDIIETRKNEMASTKDYNLPSVIYGDHPPLIEKGRIKNLKGTGTSPGIFTGKTRIVTGMADFVDVARGDVVVIPFSDVSWTPILSIAGAIVSETGGLLSHCSIIAREMGIPALVSVENACTIGNCINVTVDGSNGILTIHNHE